ncbi:hypothetical protein IE53DRAFT_345351 [Violaceomyces palustris]|uniref:Uncharacterized protein n=1 Tax=Violaceomyces palustris TaxID=1673888 RepID=A0ACD0NV57_9BASI|nr:hypothetical protein IE53DRAFT_345351 [Violaceomyces palustris]
MSSFKRRGASAQSAPLPPGVKPSSFSSPVPLLSTGVPALDDILSGGGLSSGSIFVLIPATGTAAGSSSQIGAAANTPASQAEQDHIARAAAEPYAELILAYSIAQGIASKHCGIIMGENAESFVNGIMGRAGDVEEKEIAAMGPSMPSSSTLNSDEAAISETLGATEAGDDEEEQQDDSQGSSTNSQRQRDMKIAWRYEKLNQFKTTVENSGSKTGGSDDIEAFCSTFDLSKRISPRILQKAKADHVLNLLEIDYDTFSGAENSFDRALDDIKARAEACKKVRDQNPSLAPPVLRISIRSLGSPSWRILPGQCRSTEIIRFFMRLKIMLRGLALPEAAGSNAQAKSTIPAIATVTLSPFSMAAPHPDASRFASPSNLTHRISHIVDACISLSTFSSSPALRAAFPSYTGALKVLKTPSIGTMTNPSMRASVLRGMGAGAATRGGEGGLNLGSSGTVGEGGAGGGENNLAFKVKRKRLVIETLHLDVEGGVSERRTKPPKGAEEILSKAKSGTSTLEPEPSGRTGMRPPHQAAGSATSAIQTSPASSRASIGASGPSTGPVKFGGLKALRERGLASVGRSGTPSAENSRSEMTRSVREVEVEIDNRTHDHAHSRGSHTHGQGKQRRGPVFESDRPQDYEF